LALQDLYHVFLSDRRSNYDSNFLITHLGSIWYFLSSFASNPWWVFKLRVHLRCGGTRYFAYLEDTIRQLNIEIKITTTLCARVERLLLLVPLFPLTAVWHVRPVSLISDVVLNRNIINNCGACASWVEQFALALLRDICERHTH
jgi:hypothetical protein